MDCNIHIGRWIYTAVAGAQENNNRFSQLGLDLESIAFCRAVFGLALILFFRTRRYMEYGQFTSDMGTAFSRS